MAFKRIAFLSDYHPYDESVFITGSHLQVYNIAKELSYDKDFEIHLIVSTKDPNKEGKVLKEGNMYVHYLKRPRFDILKVPLYLKELDRIKPSVVFQRGRDALTFVGYLSKVLYSSKFIWSSNALEGLRFLKYTLMFSKRKFLIPYGLILDTLANVGMESADMIIAQNEKQKEYADRRFWWKETSMCYNIQENPKIEPRKTPEPTLVWVGRITENKNPQMFIKLAKDLPDYEFIMIGFGDTSLIKDDTPKNFRYLGRLNRDEIMKILSESWLMVLTSPPGPEGLPNVMIEAFLCETPVIAFDHGIDILKSHGLVCENYDDMKTKIKNLLEDRDELLRKGKDLREFAIRNFVIKSSQCWKEIFR